MNILITGATGKVGSRLTLRLAHQGHHLRALVRDRKRGSELAAAGIDLVEGDLLDADSLRTAVQGMDSLVHCAAHFRGATPQQADAVNLTGTQHLGRAALAAGVTRLLFLSTGLVYGSNGGRHASEDDPCAPTVAYPVSKLAAEHALLALEGLDVCILRLPFVYGEGDPHIAEIVPVLRNCSPTQRMSLVHHQDVAQAVTCVLEAPSLAHRVYNVVDDEAPTLAELFRSVNQPAPNGTDETFGLAFDALLDGRRIREELGFKPAYPTLQHALAASRA